MCPGSPCHGPAPNSGPATEVGVIPFTIDGIDHGLVAAVLGYEHGVGVRSGCFCAHPYIAHLLQPRRGRRRRRGSSRCAHGDKRGVPGMVRISFGCYNDRPTSTGPSHALEQVVVGDFTGRLPSRSRRLVPSGRVRRTDAVLARPMTLYQGVRCGITTS